MNVTEAQKWYERGYAVDVQLLLLYDSDWIRCKDLSPDGWSAMNSLESFRFGSKSLPVINDKDLNQREFKYKDEEQEMKTVTVNGVILTEEQIIEAYKKLQEPEFEYPLFKRFKKTGEIAKFTALQTREIVWRGNEAVGYCNKVGHITEISISHTDNRWEDVPYNKERDLWDTQPVLCKDDNWSFGGDMRFYDAIYDRAFRVSDGTRTGPEYDTIKPLSATMYDEELTKEHAKLKV